MFFPRTDAVHAPPRVPRSEPRYLANLSLLHGSPSQHHDAIDALNRNDTIPKTRVQVEPKWPASCVFVSVSLGANVVERSSGVPGPSTLTETGIALVSTLSKWYKWRQTVTVLIRHHPRATRNRRDISPTHHRSIPCSFLSPPAILDFTIDLSSLHCPTHRTRHSIII
jgi:hypothetical protein